MHENKLSFTGHDSDTIKLFLFWLYQGELPDFKRKVKAHPRNTRNEKSLQEMVANYEILLIRWWGLGDAYLMPKLQNAAVKSTLQLTSNHTSVGPVREAYRLTQKGSPLRVLFMDEARYECLACIDRAQCAQDFVELMREPGFFAEFVEPLQQNEALSELDIFDPANAIHRGSKETKYMVDEG